MASNPLVDIFRVKELRQRILYTLFMLLIFRLGVVLPIPGVNIAAIDSFFQTQTGGAFELLDFFAGGAFKNFSVLMLGVTPYISAQIIMQIVVLVFPKLKKLQEDEAGKKKIKLYTRIGTIAVAVIQAYAFTNYAGQIPGAISDAGLAVLGLNHTTFMLLGILAITTGTMFLMWMGDQITQRGIGNGVSLLIFAGIVARLPHAIFALVQKIQQKDGLNPVIVIVVLAMFVAVIMLVVYEQRGQRKIPVNYAKRVVGRRMYGAQNTYIPFKINPSGVIPVIFAQSILTFPVQIAQSMSGNVGWLNDVSNFLRWDGFWYNFIYVILIVFFGYFYTQVSLNPKEISKQVRENGGSIPGIRSEKMEEYLNKILTRILLPGSLYLGFIALIPTLVQRIFNFPAEISMLMGGTSLLILVGVDLDTMSQIESHLRMHHHDGLTKKGRIRGRNL